MYINMPSAFKGLPIWLKGKLGLHNALKQMILKSIFKVVISIIMLVAEVKNLFQPFRARSIGAPKGKACQWSQAHITQHYWCSVA